MDATKEFDRSTPTEPQRLLWSELERHLLAAVESGLAAGVELEKWRRELQRDNAYDGRFELSARSWPADTSFGFTGKAPVAGRQLAVMGNVREMFFDRPKPHGGNLGQAARWLKGQVREFALRYFVRVSDFCRAEAFPATEPCDPPSVLRPLAWCKEETDRRGGFGFEQLLYKRREDGKIGRFAAGERFAVDLTAVESTYEWIILKVDIFDFQLRLAPLGEDAPHLVVPLPESSYLVVSDDFIVRRDRASETELGRYGIGWAFLPDPEKGLLAYGPGSFKAACQSICFHVGLDGEVRVRMAFVADRPEKVLNVSLDPMSWGERMADYLPFGGGLLDSVRGLLPAAMPRPGSVDPLSSYIQFANLLSGGRASSELGISKEQLERSFLLRHFTQHYNVVVSALPTWRQVADWRVAADQLPAWVTSGVAAPPVKKSPSA